MPSTATFVAPGVLVLLWFLLDGLPVLGASSDSKLVHPDSNQENRVANEKHVNVSGCLYNSEFSLKYEEVLDPLQRPNVFSYDVSIIDPENG